MNARKNVSNTIDIFIIDVPLLSLLKTNIKSGTDKGIIFTVTANTAKIRVTAFFTLLRTIRLYAIQSNVANNKANIMVIYLSISLIFIYAL